MTRLMTNIPRLGWIGVALALGACFAGDSVQGLACDADVDCGPNLACVDGYCGGPGLNGLCGNGLVDQGEACDDGNVEDGDGCTSLCQLPICGDGLLGPGEVCDDGNGDDTDDCTSVCTLPGQCGNGVTEPGEECDDGNDDDTDNCTNACTLAACGDGVVGPDEECDDGNGDDTDECVACKNARCGDGHVQGDEECDHGDMGSSTCTPACRLTPDPPSLELTLAQVKQLVFDWAPVPGATRYELERVDLDTEEVKEAYDIDESGFSLTVPLYRRLGAGYRLRACNDSDCSAWDEVEVEGDLGEAIGYFKASNTGEASIWGFGVGDAFGTSVALSADGRTLAVGAINEDSDSQGIGGDDGNHLTYPNPFAYDAGAVYVFVRDDEGGWSQQAYVKASATQMAAQFGGSVALSADGDTLAVGAHGESSWQGAVHVFRRSGETWSELEELGANVPGNGDGFGWSVALSAEGNRLVVGAPGEDSGVLEEQDDDNNVFSAGAVYVFQFENGDWYQEAYLKASTPEAGARFGGRVALSANGVVLAASADGESSSDGAVHVFERVAGNWERQAHIVAPTADIESHFGRSLALSDDSGVLAVGSGSELEPDESAVHVFERQDDTWLESARLQPASLGAADQFGSSLALTNSGTTLFVGAWGEAGDATGLMLADPGEGVLGGAGAVYLFDRVGDAWVESVYIKAPVVSAGYAFGASLAATSDTLVVGSVGEASLATGIGGDPFNDAADGSGAVYVY